MRFIVFCRMKGVDLQMLKKMDRKEFWENEKVTMCGELQKRTQVETMILAAMFLALGIVMPFLTGQIPAIGNRLLPMHIPVLICGFVCGWKYGMIVGFVVPILRSILFGMPPMFPTAAAMAFELAVYGMVTGLMHEWRCSQKLYKNDIVCVYVTLITAMIAGRLVWGMISVLLYGLAGNVFSFSLFVAGAFFNAIPGIVLQLIIIPAIVMTLKRAKMIEF